MFDDLPRAFRHLRRYPTATMLYVLVMSSGLTACLVVYGILHYFFVKPMPFPDADRLVAISAITKQSPSDDLGSSVDRPAWEALKDNAAFAGVGGWFGRPTYWGRPAEDLVNQWVASSSLFGVLGVTPALGRLFTAADDAPESDVAVVSWKCWQRRLGGRADVLG